MNRPLLPLLLLALGPAPLVAAQSTWYVPDNFATIQQAIDASQDGDTVIVRDGIYQENLNFRGRGITLRSENGAATTVIEGGGTAPVVVFDHREKRDSVLRGFKIRDGLATSPVLQPTGGGVRCDTRTAPVIEDCIFEFNNGYRGAGLGAIGASPTLTRCIFRSNFATENGGGVALDGGSTVVITDCSFLFNSAQGGGGGLYSFQSGPVLLRCEFRTNSALSAISGGGAISLRGDSFLHPTTVVECSFTTNLAQNHGGAVYAKNYNFQGDALFRRCSFEENTAIADGGAVYLEDFFELALDHCTLTNANVATRGASVAVTDFAELQLSNSILFDNDADDLFVDTAGNAAATVSYCIVEGGWPGTGNLDRDPGLRVDLTLMSGSPCIDAGDPAGAADPGNTRADIGMKPFEQALPHLIASALTGEEPAAFLLKNATPASDVLLAWSLAGGGPTNTAYGDAFVTPPYQLSRHRTDASGRVVWIKEIPAALAGSPIWIHGVDLGSGAPLNPLALTIQ